HNESRGAVLWHAGRVMLAVGTGDTGKTEGAIPACAATVTSSVVTGAGSGVGNGVVLGACTNEAKPDPAGWLAMVRRKLLSKLVRSCRTITNARCSVALSGLEVCGARSATPSVMRAE